MRIVPAALPLGMHHKIYFGNQKLIFTNDAAVDSKSAADTAGDTRTYTAGADMAWALDQIKAGRPRVVLVHSDTNLLLAQLKEHLSFAAAAGGLVLGPDEHVLLIYRQGKWDLPKGHLDAGETLAACALREVEEETGLTGVAIRQSLGATYHTYWRDGVHWLKASYWYLMESAERSEPIPQTEEDIEQCIWVPIEELDRYMKNTHPSIADVITLAWPLLVG